MTSPLFRTLAETLQFRSCNQPDRKAYTFLKDGEVEAGSFTYRQLDSESRTIAAMLTDWRVQRPLLIYPPGLDFIVAFFGCIYAGVTPVPAGLPHLSRIGRSLTRLSAIATDAGSDVVLSTRRVIERATADPEFTVRSPALARMRWLATDEIDSEQGSAEIASKSDGLAFIQYTSGSTSMPKGVMVSHRSLMHNLECCNVVEENDDSTVSVSWLPHSHDMGLIEAILLPVYAGYPAYLMSPAAFLRRPVRWLQAISTFGATNSGGPNFAFDLCLERISPEQQEGLDLRSWRVAYNGAETIRGETIRRFAHRFNRNGFRWSAFYPVYGLAESTLLVTSGRRNDSPVLQSIDSVALRKGAVQPATDSLEAVTIVGCGRPAPGSTVVIVDPETCVECERGKIGEIWISGNSVADGYWRRAPETERTFRAQLAGDPHSSYLRTGDLGFLDDGKLFVTGRIKDVINIRGFKHYPQDIERTIEEDHPELYRNGCAAVALPSASGDALGIVAEVRAPIRHPVSNWRDDLIASVCKSVAMNHGIEVQTVALVRYGTIPRTTSGKLQRHACSRFFAGELETA